MAKKKEIEKIEKDKNAGKVLSDGTILRKKRVPKALKIFVVICLILLGFIGCLYAYIEFNVKSNTRKCSNARNCVITTDRKGNQLFQCEYCLDDECNNKEEIQCQAYGGVKNG